MYVCFCDIQGILAKTLSHRGYMLLYYCLGGQFIALRMYASLDECDGNIIYCYTVSHLRNGCAVGGVAITSGWECNYVTHSGLFVTTSQAGVVLH